MEKNNNGYQYVPHPSLLIEKQEQEEEFLGYISKQGWRSQETQKVFSKKSNNIIKDFRSLSTPNNRLGPLQIIKVFDTFYSSTADFSESLNILNNAGDTDFIISGIQHALIKNLNDQGSHIIHQPVIRLNGDSKGSFYVDGLEGIGTSFINTTLYHRNANIHNLIYQFEEFLTFLSKISIYVGDISITTKIKQQLRNKEDAYILMIYFYYGNLNIGDLSLVNFNNGVSLIDLGFGLERLSLARNKYKNYFSQYLSGNEDLSKRYSNREIDYIKTICLLHTTRLDELFKETGPVSTYKTLFKGLNKERNYYPLLKIFTGFRQNFYKDTIIKEKILDDMEKYSI